MRALVSDLVVKAHARLDLLTALAGVVLVVSCTGPGMPSDQPLPPTDATPGQVMTAYLTALEQNDCSTARALGTDTFRKGNGELCGVVAVSRHSPLEQAPARPSGDVVFSSTLTVSGGDASLPDGDRLWCWVIVRQPSTAWRITGGGGAC